jgi:hypothetical protein
VGELPKDILATFPEKKGYTTHLYALRNKKEWMKWINEFWTTKLVSGHMNQSAILVRSRQKLYRMEIELKIGDHDEYIAGDFNSMSMSQNDRNSRTWLMQLVWPAFHTGLTRIHRN